MIEIIRRCKCGVFFYANTHRDIYQSVEDKIIKISSDDNDILIDENIKKKMIETNTILELQFYPNTPIGFYRIFHYDYDKLIEEAKKILDKYNNIN